MHSRLEVVHWPASNCDTGQQATVTKSEQDIIICAEYYLAEVTRWEALNTAKSSRQAVSAVEDMRRALEDDICVYTRWLRLEAFNKYTTSVDRSEALKKLVLVFKHLSRYLEVDDKINGRA